MKIIKNSIILTIGLFILQFPIQILAQKGQTQSQVLKLNQILERKLTSKQIHDYRFTLKANEFIQIQVEQKGIDVSLSVHSADGKKLSEMDSPNGTEGFETLSFIADKTGVYIFKVKRLEQESNSQSGNYTIKLTAQRISNKQDQERIRAEKQFYSVVKITLGKIEDIQPKIDKYNDLLPVWHKLKDDYLVGLIKQTINELKQSQQEIKAAKKKKELQEAEEEKARKDEQEKANENFRDTQITKRRAIEVQRKASENLPQLIVESGHSFGINSIAFSPNGKFIASGSNDNTVKLWDVASGKELRTFRGHNETVESVAFSPDGSKIISVSGDLVVILWEITTGQNLRVFDDFQQFDHVEPDLKIQFSPDGGKIGLSSYNGQSFQCFWNIQTGKSLRFPKVDSDNDSTDESYIALSSDWKTMAIYSNDNFFSIWNLETGNKAKEFKGNDKGIQSLLVSPNGKSLVTTSGHELTVDIWDIKTEKKIQTLIGHTAFVYKAGFLHDEETIVSFGSKETIEWNINTGKKLNQFQNDGLVEPVISQNENVIAILNAESESGNINFRLWDLNLQEEAKIFSGHIAQVKSVIFSSDGKTIASCSADATIKLWNIGSRKLIKTFESRVEDISRVRISPDGRSISLESEGISNDITIWSMTDGKSPKTLKFKDNTTDEDNWSKGIYSPDKIIFATFSSDNLIRLWDANAAQELKTLRGHKENIYSIKFSVNGKNLVSVSSESIIVWDVITGKEKAKIIIDENNQNTQNRNIFISFDGIVLVFQEAKQIVFWNLLTNQKFNKTSVNDDYQIDTGTLNFSSDGRIFAASITENVGKSNLILGDLLSGKKFRVLDSIVPLSENGRATYRSIYFSANREILATLSDEYIVTASEFIPQETFNKKIKLWDVASGKLIKSYDFNDPNTAREVFAIVPDIYLNNEYEPITPDGNFQIKPAENGKVSIYELKTGKLIADLILIGEEDWAVVAPDGRFDTNKLENPKGLHWLLPNDPFTPVSLEVFTRNYFEPNLLPRLLKCTEEETCDKEFKPLPSIADINRVQPKVSIKEIKSIANSSDLADVTVEVENATEDINISAADRTKKVKLTSGAFDLRLFRDGQLVGVSTPKAKLEPFIKAAPDLIGKNKEYFKRTGKLTNTPEDVAWREANDIFALVGSENVKRISPDKLEYTFCNVRLPKGQTSVDFTAYAFNSDKVKSTTTEPFKFEVPKTIAAAKKKGRAFVVSIGVNASENPAYDLRYAANDARKMQEVVGARLEGDSGKYAEVVKIPLVSDYDKNKNLTENTAQKAIIKGVFSLLSGNEKEVPADILKQIPNREQIKQIEPEDTLIITFSGHGYADQSGIFYLLPYDIGKDTLKLSPAALQKIVSSDELSLWMQDITAAEMIMIIDACHSSAAVQGDGFKPGPMGSRGLGQLAYDKDMKILSATQANNVALELGSLQQGLLSYALLEDGIVKSLADTDKDKKLFSDEWLSFAEKRVPELYSEVKDGRRDIIIDGKVIKSGGNRTAEIISSVGKKNGNLDLQQPTVFDFKRRNAKNVLFSLP